MRYLGGKSRLSKYIVSILLDQIGDCHYYAEPFVGSAAIAAGVLGVRDFKQAYLSDVSIDLMLLYMGLKNDWVPPSCVSLDTYNTYRAMPPSKLRGFIGYGCSWGGKWFGGYARGENRNYAAESQRALLKTIKKIHAATFFCANYIGVRYPPKTLIYCDPPYANSTKYRNDFDHDLFWSWCRNQSVNNVVIVSEYFAPDDFRVIWEKKHHTSVRSKNKSVVTTEKLFKLR
jgi:DNA adenine methylase